MKQYTPKVLALAITVIIFLMFLLASCKSKQKVITEQVHYDSLEVTGEVAVQQTATATSSAVSLNKLFEQLTLGIDSIVITMPSVPSNSSGESAYGRAWSPVTPHDHLPSDSMAEGCAFGDNADATRGAVATQFAPLKTAPIPSLRPAARISPNNIPKGKIVISGIRLNQQSAATNTNITASCDTTSEVISRKAEMSSVNKESTQIVEGKPRSKRTFEYIILIVALALSVGYLMKKFHFFTWLINFIKRIF